MYRLKHSFTAGELSPLMDDRIDFDRYKNGCKTLRNAACLTQGPATRRPGTRFVYDLDELGQDPTDPRVRLIPFEFNEEQAYVMIFFVHTDGDPRMVLGYTEPDGTAGLVVGSGGSTVPVGEVVELVLPTDFDIEGMDWAQSGDEMYIAQSGYKPHIIRRLDTDDWELVEVTFTNQPTDWDDTKGWPERVTFHQQRLVFAANILRRRTIWMTQAGDFSSFAVSSPLVDSDAVTFTLDSGTQNKIRWITSGRSLNVGTLGNEWTVVGGTQTALTPSNILSQRQTNNGSEPNKPLNVGITTLFIERHGRTVNEFVYDYNVDSYKTSDMAVLSSHLTERYSIKDWTYQQTPGSMIWCVREDGELLGLTYQRDHKVVGWHQHDTQGEFLAVTSVPGETREDDVWFMVKREVNGVDKYYVEKMEDWLHPETAEESRYLDSALLYDDTPITTVTGLDHLEGETVSILADGTVHEDLVVDNGSVTLDNAYSVIYIGLSYITEIVPHLMEIPEQDGTTLSRDQRASRIDIDFYKSLGCTYGRIDSEDGETHEEELPFRVPADLTGQAVPLFTGFKRVEFPEGYDNRIEYFLRQSQPLPMVIRCVVDRFKVN